MCTAKTPIRRASPSTRHCGGQKGAYRIRVVHGFHGGTALRDMIYDEYSARANVLRIVRVGDGVTELILREL